MFFYLYAILKYLNNLNSDKTFRYFNNAKELLVSIWKSQSVQTGCFFNLRDPVEENVKINVSFLPILNLSI